MKVDIIFSPMLRWLAESLIVFAALAAPGSVIAQATGVAVDGQPPLFSFTEVTMSLQRKACYGTCPVYGIEIRGDGSGVYKGEKYVADPGPHTFHLERPEILRLLTAFLSVRFFELLDKYDDFATVAPRGENQFAIITSTESDVSSAVLHLRIADRTKTIVCRQNFPSELGNLGKMIDDVTGSAAWVRGTAK
jgi:hypothetical protein